MGLGAGNHVAGLAGHLDQQVVHLLVVDDFGHPAQGLGGAGQLEDEAGAAERVWEGNELLLMRRGGCGDGVMGMEGTGGMGGL